MTPRADTLRSAARVGIPRARARFLTQAMQLEESSTPGLVSAMVFLVSMLLGGGIAWASVTELGEVARAPGEVVPDGHVRKIQHLEGGIVDEIAVSNGDRVRAGQVLVRLAASTVRAELDQLHARRAGLELRLERVGALLEDRPPDFSSWAGEHGHLVAGQASLHRDQRASYREQLALAQARVRQRGAELESITGQVESAREETRLLAELRTMRADLVERHVVARADMIEFGVKLAEATRDLREVQGQARVAIDALAEAEQSVIELESRLREQWSNEASEHAVALAEVEQSLVRAQDRLDRLTIRSPVDGVVKGMQVNTINEIVEPGEMILEVVPVARELVVESRISTSDIGHVRVGQPVDVKVTSFESTRYGSVPGTLVRLSASTFIDGDERPYYRAEIALERDHMGTEPGRHRILPGMTVQADILTGKKTVLDYVLKPVYRGFEAAFRER